MTQKHLLYVIMLYENAKEIGFVFASDAPRLLRVRMSICTSALGNISLDQEGSRDGFYNNLSFKMLLRNSAQDSG